MHDVYINDNDNNNNDNSSSSNINSNNGLSSLRGDREPLSARGR